MGLKEDIQTATEAGFIEGDKPKKSRKSAAHLGVKHTAKLIAVRAVGDSLGNGIVGSIAKLLTRMAVNKGMK